MIYGPETQIPFGNDKPNCENSYNNCRMAPASKQLLDPAEAVDDSGVKAGVWLEASG